MELLMFRKKERKGNCSTKSVNMGCIYHVYDIYILFFKFSCRLVQTQKPN